jgi:hypothetical protein
MVMSILNKVAVGFAALCAGFWTVGVLWLFSSYLFSYIGSHFPRGPVSGLLVASAPLAILAVDGFLVILAVRYVFRYSSTRKHRVTP